MIKSSKYELIISSVLEDKIKSIEEITDIQCSNGNFNIDPYMHGLANGLICSLHVLQDDYDNPYTGQKSKRPFLEAPKKWLSMTENK